MYISKYSSLSKADDNNRVVVSLTTNNVDKLKPVLNSILDQTVKVDQIALNLPPSQEHSVLPPNVKKICNIFVLGKDYGNGGSNFIPTLLREGEQNTKIIFLSDDYVYGQDLIETLVDASVDHPDKAIYTRNKRDKYEAILLKPSFIKTKLLDTEEISKSGIEDYLNVDTTQIPSQETFSKISMLCI
jgi:hypothetical protein